MAKNILFAALFLGIVIVCYWQWELIKGEKGAEQSSTHLVFQQITVKTEANSLQVTQVFHHLKPNHEYKILAPESIAKWTCVNKKGKECVSSDKDLKTFQPQSGDLKIQFFINLAEGQHSLLETNWLIKLQNVDVYESKIEIVDSVFRKGTWVTALPLKGFNRQKFIDYYVFEGRGEDLPLYWQATPLYRTNKSNFFTLYSQNANDQPTSSFPKLKLPSGHVYMVFIHSNEHAAISLPGLQISSDQLTAKRVQKVWLSNYFNHTFRKNGANPWLADVFSSLYLNEPAETEKGTFIIEQLNGQLKKLEIEKLVKAVLTQDFVQTKDLDNQLGKLKGLRTNFFSSNKSNGSASLVFWDDSQVKINGTLVANINVLKINKELFFPFIKTMKSFGYSIKENHARHAILLKKDNNQLLFNYNQSNFIYNGQKYGLLENPFRNIDGIIYLNQNALHSLFKIEIAKFDGEILLSD
ncbi:stalk domain-containing protein [Neobacillus sp. PS3-40]|uniref:stalk domain-containing protein n=1 Tax=Neobacillus sp. PS3-40 TaxID=3070679 RepID=UPI0027DF1BDA|nr:stalk domain-containing protein [Neobacillus sp. PS3-40]WML43586.1 hypothetical protein RCG20_17595 [Neobacillus sp. PS3-40]